jgi:hypothetical protein
MKWSSTAPDTEGIYWFYGDPFMGSMGIDFRDDAPKIKPELYLVEIREISNGFLAVTKGNIISLRKFNKKDKFYREGYVGYWAEAELPENPPDPEKLFE